jgi:hypothetical protein
METNGSISVDEASAALASARRSRARVAWSGYPKWYWLATGAGLGVMSYATFLPDGWDYAVVLAVAVILVLVARAASQVRGINEGCVRTTMRVRDMVLLYAPPTVLILGDAILSKFVSWSPIPGSVLVFLLFAGTGLTASARAARW